MRLVLNLLYGFARVVFGVIDTPNFNVPAIHKEISKPWEWQRWFIDIRDIVFAKPIGNPLLVTRAHHVPTYSLVKQKT